MKSISKARKLIKTIQHVEGSEIQCDLAFIGYAAEQILRERTTFDISIVKRHLFRRLVLVAEKF